VTSLKIDVEETSPVLRKLTVAVASQEVDQKINNAYQVWGKKAKVKGFRPGKAPRPILQRYFGKQIEEEVSQELLRASLDEAIKEVNLHPVMIRFPDKFPPLVAGDDYRFAVEVEVNPDFTPQDYLGVQLQDAPVVVTDEMVDKRLDEIREHNAVLTPVEGRPIQTGDWAIFDYDTIINGEPVEGGRAENYFLEVGLHKFNPQVEDYLVGKSIGFQGELPVDLPADFYNPLLAGRSVTFKLSIKDIQQREVPTLDDDFAKNLGGQFQTAADLRQAVREDLTKRAEDQRRSDLREQLLTAILEKNSFEVPPALVRQEQEGMLREQMNLIQRRGLNLVGMDQEKMMAAMAPMAERRTRSHLILDKIAEAEGVNVSDADLDAGYDKIAAAVNDTPANVKRFYQENYLVTDLIRQLREDKTVDLLLDRANVGAAATAPAVGEEVTP